MILRVESIYFIIKLYIEKIKLFYFLYLIFLIENKKFENSFK